MYISYIDLLAELPEYLKNDKDLLAGCVAGAILIKRRVSWGMATIRSFLGHKIFFRQFALSN